MTSKRQKSRAIDPDGAFFDGPYCPSPEEIAEKCKEIQSAWSEQERASRMQWAISDVLTSRIVGFPFDWRLRHDNSGAERG